MRTDIALINFINLSLQEKETVLSWRNHPDIKKWMYTNQDITLKDHLYFIESLKGKQDRNYFLVKQNHEYIGVIDFTDITSQKLEIGLYTNPAQKAKGDILMQLIIDYSFHDLHVNTVTAELFSENSKAYHLYQRYGFKEVNKKNINNREVTCMELRNENR